MDQSGPDVVERDDTPVRFIEVPDEPDAIGRAWTDLEAIVGSLRGRRFLGVVVGDRYRACVVHHHDATGGDEADLPPAVVPGGRYLRLRLRGEPPEVYDRIGPAAAFLAEQDGLDPARPVLELYLRRDRIDVLHPVR